jgi:hypothetical protein
MYLTTILLREQSIHQWSAGSRDELVSGLLFIAQGYLEDEQVVFLFWTGFGSMSVLPASGIGTQREVHHVMSALW